MPNPSPDNSWRWGNGSGSDLSGYAKHRWYMMYQDYLKRIEPYKGTSYYEQLLNNPYYQYADYGHSWFEGIWSNLTNNFGGVDKFYSDRQTSGDEYFNQVLDSMRQQAYNSPGAQASREAAAGVNVDLTGGQQISPGEASEVMPDDTPPVSPEVSDASEFMEVANLGFQFFTQVMSMGSFLQEMTGKSIQNAAADMALTDQGYDSLVKIMAGSSSLPGSIDEYEGMSEEDKLAMDKGLIRELDAAISSGQLKGMYSTKRARQLVKLLRGSIQYDKNGKPTLAYETYRSKLLAERYKSHESAAGVIGNIAFSEDLGEFGSQIADIFGRVNQAILNAERTMKEAEAKYASEYYNTTGEDGMTVGKADALAAISGDVADVAQAEYAAIKADLDKQMDAMFQEISDVCSKGKEWYHTVGKLLIPVCRSLVYRLLNSSVTFGSKTGPKGRVANSSLSF